MNCESWFPLIAAAVDGRLSTEQEAGLRAHLERCASCREEFDTQIGVSRILASRPEHQFPPVLSERLSARLDDEANHVGSAALDWRKWSLRLLPVAACLSLAAVVPHVLRQRPAMELQRATDASTPSPNDSATLALASELTDDQLSERLLWDSLVTRTKERQP